VTRLRANWALRIVVALALLLTLAAPAFALVIDNGLNPDDLTNVIDSNVGEDVWVRNLGCPPCVLEFISPDDATGVEIVAGAELGDLYVRENSHVGIRGGSLGAIDVSGRVPEDGQQIYVSVVGSGFTVDGAPVPYGPVGALSGNLAGTLESGDPLGSSFTQSFAGAIWLSPPVADALSVNTPSQPDAPPTVIDTPTTRTLVVSRDACTEAWLMSYSLRPTCHLFGHPTQAQLVTGGSVTSAYVGAHARLELAGGMVAGSVSVLQGELELRGGSVVGPIEITGEHARVTVHGTGFAVDGVPVIFSETTATSGTLTGTLESGEALSVAWTGGPLTFARSTSAPVLPTADDDLDGVPNEFDNCLLVPNGPLLATVHCDAQEDADGDGFGEPCDADVDNDGIVGVADLRLTTNSIGSAGPSVYDLTCSGNVLGDDVMAVQQRLNTGPGPSGLSCAGTGPNAPTNCTASP
jgi:hypothetical protein